MQSKTEKITEVLEKQGILQTSEVAEHTGLKAEICERVLIKLEDSGIVFAVESDSWMLN